MAKSKLTKWIIGATGVAAFTGFIGGVHQFDTTKQSASAPIVDTLKAETDAVKQEWQAAINNSEDDDNFSNIGSTQNTSNLNLSGGTTTVPQTVQTPRTRAS